MIPLTASYSDYVRFFKEGGRHFFTVDDTEEKSAEKGKNIVNSGAAATYVAPPVATVNVSGAQPDTAATEKFRAYFKKLYDKANVPGPDFYEYHNMVEAMGSLIADEVKYPSGLQASVDKSQRINC